MTWENGEYQPKQKRADEKKQRILDAALDLFSEQGFNKTTAKEIAARAGVATGSFYRYYKDKKAVFMSCCRKSEDFILGGINEFMARFLAENYDHKRIMAELVRFAVVSHRRNKRFHREVLAMEILDKDIAEMAEKREKRVRAFIVNMLAEAGVKSRVKNLDVAVYLMLLAIEEVSHKVIIFDSEVNEDVFIDELVDMLNRYFYD